MEVREEEVDWVSEEFENGPTGRLRREMGEFEPENGPTKGSGWLRKAVSESSGLRSGFMNGL